jgi:hypothetical protein
MKDLNNNTNGVIMGSIEQSLLSFFKFPLFWLILPLELLLIWLLVEGNNRGKRITYLRLTYCALLILAVIFQAYVIVNIGFKDVQFKR